MPRRAPLLLWLQTPHGELRGETRLLERFRMSFEMSAPLRPGDAADFRLRLPDAGDAGNPGEVRGTVRVLRIIDAHHGAPSLFSGEIVNVRRADLPILESWLGNHATDGRRRFEAMSGSETPDIELSDPGATDAYDPIDLPGMSVTRTVSSAPYGFSSVSGSPDLRLAGREAIRSALRRGLGANSGRPGRPGGGRSRRWMEHTRQRAEAQARHWLSGESDPSPSVADSQEPTVQILPDQTPTAVRVRWRSVDAFRRDWRMHLKGGGLFIVSNEPLPRNRSVFLRMDLPSGRFVECAAQVVAPMPTGTGLSLRLGPEQRKQLESELE